MFDPVIFPSFREMYNALVEYLEVHPEAHIKVDDCPTQQLLGFLCDDKSFHLPLTRVKSSRTASTLMTSPERRGKFARHLMKTKGKQELSSESWTEEQRQVFQNFLAGSVE